MSNPLLKDPPYRVQRWSFMMNEWLDEDRSYSIADAVETFRRLESEFPDDPWRLSIGDDPVMVSDE